MAAVGALLFLPAAVPIRLTPRHRRPPTPFRAFSYSSSPSQETYRGPQPQRNLVADWVTNNDGLARSLPIYAGGISLLAVLANRAFSGVAPVADASRAWEALSSATCSKSLVVVYGDDSLLQIGVAAESSVKRGEAVAVDVPKLIQGLLYKSVLESGKQSYLANLSLYPGRSELPFLPENTQAVILQPLGDRGIAIIGGDTIRGFSNLDQAWVTLIAEKLDATLSKSSGTDQARSKPSQF